MAVGVDPSDFPGDCFIQEPVQQADSIQVLTRKLTLQHLHSSDHQNLTVYLVSFAATAATGSGSGAGISDQFAEQ